MQARADAGNQTDPISATYYGNRCGENKISLSIDLVCVELNGLCAIFSSPFSSMVFYFDLGAQKTQLLKYGA